MITGGYPYFRKPPDQLNGESSIVLQFMNIDDLGPIFTPIVVFSFVDG